MATIGPFGFVGGLNNKASALTLPKDQMSAAQNVHIIYGDLSKRSGSAKINSSALNSGAAITGIADWQTAAGQRNMVVVCGDKIYKSADLNTSPSDITGSVTVTAGQNNQHTFASLNDLLVICGGTTPDAPIKWSGSGNCAALGGSPPSGNIVCVANNFMFIAGIAATPSKLQWSNVADPETWTSINFVNVNKNDGDKITALIAYSNNLIIFKRRSIWQLNTNPPTSDASVTLGPLTQIGFNIGCAGAQAVDIMPDGRVTFFAVNGHLYTYDGSNFSDLSDRPVPQGAIQPTFDSCNSARFQYAVVRYYPTDDELWCSISNSGSGTNNLILNYNRTYDIWNGLWTGIAANVMTQSIDTRATPSHPVLMLTGSYAGFVYEQDSGTSNAEAASGTIDGYGTISVQIGVDDTDFTPRSAVVLYEASSGTLEFNYGFNGLTLTNKSKMLDQSVSGGSLGTFVLGIDVLGGASTLRKVVTIESTAREAFIQIQFENNTSTDGFTVHPIFLSDGILV